MQSYRFDQVANVLYEFIWNEYCDWYLEFTKAILRDEGESETHKGATAYTLVKVLETTMRLAHPVMPFLTETIWTQTKQLLGEEVGTGIMTAPYPEAADFPPDLTAEAEIGFIEDFATTVRNLRAELKVAPNVVLTPMLRGASELQRRCCTTYFSYLKDLANLDKIRLVSAGEELPPCTAKPLGEAEVLLEMKDLINRDEELKRLSGLREKLERNIKGAEARLGNEAFVSKAPPEIITGAREQLALNRTQLEKVQAQLEQLKKL